MKVQLPSTGFRWECLPLRANLARLASEEPQESDESCYLHPVSGAKPHFCSCGLGPGCPSLVWPQLQRISKKFFEVFGL